MTFFAFLRDIFQIIIFIPLSIVVGASMLIHVLVDGTWQDLYKKVTKEKPEGYQLLWVLVVLIGIVNVPARFALRHLRPLWEDLLKKVFTLGV